MSWAILVLIIVLMVCSVLKPEWFRRRLDLFRAELPKAWLVNIDMSGAKGSCANLQGANLEQSAGFGASVESVFELAFFGLESPVDGGGADRE